jgi:hypothetical protein
VSEEGDVVIALAGRRIDAPSTEPPRFPLSKVEIVAERLRHLFREKRPDVLVSSVACGADLVAIAEAGALGIRRRIVLPFNRERFRTSSATDRPGDWGSVFDRVTQEALKSSDLIVIEDDVSDDSVSYDVANLKIIDEAVSLTEAGQDPMSVLVWEGASRGDNDLTAAFGRAAALRGCLVVHIPTL